MVTGASGGIGLATSIALARVGFEVFGTVRTPTGADEVERAAKASGVSITTVLCDLGFSQSYSKAFERVAELTDGGPWALVNNAAIAQPGAVEDVPENLAHAQLQVNLVAPTMLMRSALPIMRARRDGRIVNISSISGRIATPYLGWYAASKHGLEAISDAARREVSHFGVKVIVVEPGNTRTGIWRRSARLLPDTVSPIYESDYRLFSKVEDRVKSMPPPETVARAVRLALTHPRPRPRYIVGKDAVTRIFLHRVLPTAATDYLVRRRMAGMRAAAAEPAQS